MKLSQLRVLVEVARFGNFSEAALQMAHSQSAVSHAVASLEDELGIVLFSRGRYGAHLTPAGERIRQYAQQVMRLVDQIENEARLQKGLEGGQVRISSFRSVATHILPPIIARFRECLPNITVSITEYNDYYIVEQMLREGRTEIGFTCMPTTKDFESWEVIRDDYILLLPASWNVRKAPLSWDKLLTYPFIFTTNNSCYTLLEKHLHVNEIHLKVAYEVNEDSTIVSMVAQGLGASIMPRLAAEPIPPQVKIYPLPDPLERVIGVAVSANALLSPAVYAFLDAIRGEGLFKNWEPTLLDPSGIRSA